MSRLFTTSITDRGISEYPYWNKRMSKQTYPDELGFSCAHEFIDYIEGRRVLDLASGAGILAREVDLLGIDSHVMSLDPAYGDEEKTEQIRDLAKVRLQGYGLTEGEFDHNNASFIANATAGYSDDLSMFDTGSFDRVLSVLGIDSYFMNEERLKRTLKEIARVLKRGGEFKTSPALSCFVHNVHQLVGQLKLPFKITIDRDDRISLQKN